MVHWEMRCWEVGAEEVIEMTVAAVVGSPLIAVQMIYLETSLRSRYKYEQMGTVALHYPSLNCRRSERFGNRLGSLLLCGLFQAMSFLHLH